MSAGVLRLNVFIITFNNTCYTKDLMAKSLYIYFLECKLIKTSTILFYSITNSNQMIVHLLYDNMIIQCINETWRRDYWDDSLNIASTTSK